MFDPNNIRRGPNLDSPDRIMIYGIEKIGKTTFASMFPKPFFIETEDGSDKFDTEGYRADSWDDVIGVMNYLAGDAGDQYETLVIDSIDWAERLASKHLAKKFGVSDIGTIPYGDGYSALRGEMNALQTGLTHLRQTKGLAILLICHAEVKKYQSPDVPTYDRYALTLDKKVERMFKDWVDILGFANYEVLVSQEQDGFSKRNIPASRAQAVLYTRHRPAADAGSRFPLPPKIPFDYPTFEVELANAKKRMAAEADSETGIVEPQAVTEIPQSVPAGPVQAVESVPQAQTEAAEAANTNQIM